MSNDAGCLNARLRASGWAAYLSPFDLAYLAGHSDFSTTKRYVPPNVDALRATMERARMVQSGHKIGHSAEIQAGR